MLRSSNNKVKIRTICYRMRLLCVCAIVVMSGLQGCATWRSEPEERIPLTADPLTPKKIAALQKEAETAATKAPTMKLVAACSTDCPDLLDRLRAGFALPKEKNEQVLAQIQYYQTHPDTLSRNLRRAEKYLHFVITELESQGMPLELALLPYVESNYNPFAYSSGQAAGLWQFIPTTGEHYGLKQTWWYDGRRDVAESTRAALTYLNRLVKRFDGDWYLALAAYNAGQGAVGRMLARNRESGKPEDFWSLPLSTETRNYVPKLLALSLIVQNPTEYGFDLPALANEHWFEFIDVLGQIDLALVAELTGMTEDDVVDLNPGFNRWATDPEGPHVLLIPKGNAESFRQALEHYPPDARVRWERHRIKSGDTLIALAKRYDTTVSILQDENNLKGHVIRAGSILIVPRTRNRPQGGKLRQAPSGRTVAALQKVLYTVRPGDALYTISQRFSVAVEDLVRWNNISDPTRIRPGDQLTIMVDVSKTAEKS